MAESGRVHAHWEALADLLLDSLIPYFSPGTPASSCPDAPADPIFATVNRAHPLPPPADHKAATSAIFDNIECWSTPADATPRSATSAWDSTIHHRGHGRADSSITSDRPLSVDLGQSHPVRRKRANPMAGGSAVLWTRLLWVPSPGAVSASAYLLTVRGCRRGWGGFRCGRRGTCSRGGWSIRWRCRRWAGTASRGRRS